MDLKEKNIAEMIAKVIEEGKTANSVELICDFKEHFHLWSFCNASGRQSYNDVMM